MRLAYLCLQPRVPGSASMVHVEELVAALRRMGSTTEVYEVPVGLPPSLLARAAAGVRLQLSVLRKCRNVDALYVRMHPLALMTVLAARALGRPVAVEVNGVASDYTEMWPRLRPLLPLLRALLAWQIRASTVTFAVTEGLARWARRWARPERVVLLPNAVDLTAFAPGLPRPSDVPDKYVLYFGSLSPWQGVETALAATRQQSWPAGCPLVVIGRGPSRTAVERAAADQPGSVYYLGVRPHDELPAYVSNALTSLCLKAYHKPTAGQSPMKIYESLSCGTPVISTLLHGATDVSALQGGLLVLANGSPQAVAQAAQQLMADVELRTRLGGQGRAGLENETWDARASQVLSVLGLNADPPATADAP